MAEFDGQFIAQAREREFRKIYYKYLSSTSRILRDPCISTTSLDKGGG